MNNKSVLISVRPQWCERIANGDKTLEIRKNRPKQKAPFKCYIYCTKESKHLCLMQNEGGVKLIVCCDWTTAIPVGGSVSNGKVIGEFICDNIINLFANSKFWMDEKAVKQSCLTENQIREYANGQESIYGWHISDLQIYDKPRKLSEFGLNRAPQSWCYVGVSK